MKLQNLLFLANDVEASEDGVVEIAPVEISPKEFEELQNDMYTTREHYLVYYYKSHFQ